MKKMQWPALKILTILFGALCLFMHQAHAQVSNYRLQQADSLFNAKQYTQSLEHYQVILQSEQFTPAMLLKMAFIQEGLNKTGEALYYLNLYYIATQDESALNKMDELSSKNNLEGYKNSQATLALTFYRKHHVEISLVIAGIMFFLFSLAVYSKKHHQQPVAAVVTLFVFGVAFCFHLYAGNPASTGIVARANTYLMSGPSGGASVAAIIQAGHRVEITGKEDVWLKINWRGKPAYIKENLLLPVTL